MEKGIAYRNKLLRAVYLMTLLVIVGCAAPATPDTSAVQTAAAQTVIAEVTAKAQTPVAPVGSPTRPAQPPSAPGLTPGFSPFANLTPQQTECLRAAWGTQAFQEITTFKRPPSPQEGQAMVQCGVSMPGQPPGVPGGTPLPSGRGLTPGFSPFANLTPQQTECLRAAWGTQAFQEITTFKRPPSPQEGQAMVQCGVSMPGQPPGAPAGTPPASPPRATPAPTPSDITVKFTDSTYRIAKGGTSGWFRTGQSADIMLSGIDFNNTGGPLLFNHPGVLASDGKRLLLPDIFNNRVLIWNSLPTGNSPPDIVLGQESFYTNNPGTGLNQMNWPVSVSTDGQHIVVADTYNDRILIWNTFPTRSGQPADLVIQGDANPSDPKRNIKWPWGVWTGSGKLVVTSTRSSSVLIWNAFPTKNNQPADIHLTAPGSIGTPRTITSDGKHLIVGDHNAFGAPGKPSKIGNFFWKTFPTTDNQPYDFFMSEPVDPQGSWMQGVFTPEGKLILVGDRRLLIWNSYPESSTHRPDLIVEPIAAPPAMPGLPPKFVLVVGDGSGAAFAQGRLYVSEYNGNRIVGFNSLPTKSGDLPDFAIGSPDIRTNTLETNYFIANPNPVSDGKGLFVSSDLGRKLYVWKQLPDESGAKPDIVYSLQFEPPFEPWDNALYGNTFCLAGKDRVLIWNRLPRNGELPDLHFKGKIGNVTFKELKGVALDNRYFYLADRNANKIYVWEGIPNQDMNPKFSIDIELPTRLSSDGTFLVAAATEAGDPIKIYRIDQLSSGAQPTVLTGIRVNLPEGVLAVSGHLFVADTGNNRVLVWKKISDAVAGKAPDVVLGKENLNDTRAEIGINRLFMPANLSYDGNYLWVGEYKFSGRVLRFSVQP